MREQKLIDMMFQMVMLTTDAGHRDHFAKLTNEEKAEWVRKQLKDCGFPTTPCGSSWGVL